MYTRRRFLGAIGIPTAYATLGAPILPGRLARGSRTLPFHQ